jgi:dolichol kinase
MAKSPLLSEILRKLFHSLMGLVAVVNWIGGPAGPVLSIGFTGICLVVFLGFDIARIRVYGYFPLRGVTDRVIRPSERTRLGPNVFFAVGTLSVMLWLFILGNLLAVELGMRCYWMLSGWLAIAAVIVAAVGDALAAIVGITWGRHRFRGDRTIEGTMAGFISGLLAFLPFWYLLRMPIIYGLVAATMLVLVDVANLPVNDNLLNPVVLGLALASVEILSVALAGLGVF